VLNDTGLVEQARALLAGDLPTVMATGEIQTSPRIWASWHAATACCAIRRAWRQQPTR